MPHFENIDELESGNQRSGRKEVIPIAPHSLQSSDYRPNKKRPSTSNQEKETRSEFPQVEVEPVSAAQMEKEFRIAGRKRKHSVSRLSWKRRLIQWFHGLLRSTPKKKSNSRRQNQGRQQRKSNRSKGQQSHQRKRPSGQNQENKQGPNRNRRHRSRSKQNRQGGSDNSAKTSPEQSQPKPKQKTTPSQNKSGSEQSQGSGNPRRKRNRRNRNRSSNSNGSSSPGSHKKPSTDS